MQISKEKMKSKKCSRNGFGTRKSRNEKKDPKGEQESKNGWTDYEGEGAGFIKGHRGMTGEGNGPSRSFTLIRANSCVCVIVTDEAVNIGIWVGPNDIDGACMLAFGRRLLEMLTSTRKGRQSVLMQANRQSRRE